MLFFIRYGEKSTAIDVGEYMVYCPSCEGHCMADVKEFNFNFSFSIGFCAGLKEHGISAQQKALYVSYYFPKSANANSNHLNA